MIIGVPKEIKQEEYRVGLTPAGAEELCKEGHTVLVETGAGEASGFPDSAYINAGADLVSKESLFKDAELIVKVKEPLPEEFNLLRQDQALFTFLHLAPNTELLDQLLLKRVTAFGYETLEQNGALPVLASMSEIAGRMAPLVGAYYLQRVYGGEGVLAPGIIGVKPAKAVVLGAGMVGTNAARVSSGIGMETVVMDKEMERLRRIDELFLGRVKTVPLATQALEEEIRSADLIVGAVLVPGARTPVLVNTEMVRSMKKGAVVVDVAVDQGGCFETTKPTTHSNPVYEVHGVLHYAVTNMPSAFPRTATLALTNATLPYIKIIAREGIDSAVSGNPAIKSALNTFNGEIIQKGLAESMATQVVKFAKTLRIRR